MQIEFIIHLHLNMCVVNQFSGAKRRDGNTELRGGTTTEHFDFLSSERFSVLSEASNSACFHQRTPGKPNSLLLFIYFYRTPFFPLINLLSSLT